MMVLKKHLPRWLFFCLFLGVASTWLPIPSSRLTHHQATSLTILDRHKNLLREVLSPQQGYGNYTPLNAIAPEFIQALIAVEDRRFFRHAGIDPAAILRAALQNLQQAEIISGGSTLSQQLIRQIYSIPGNLPGKICEAWLAMRLENTLGKTEILELYANLVPFGSLNFGIDAASRYYFDRPPAHLSAAQSTLLAGLPQAPSRYNPIRNPDAAQARQQRVLTAMRHSGKPGTDSSRHGKIAMPAIEATRREFRAPHAVDYALQRLNSRFPAQKPDSLVLTIDSYLQERIAAIVNSELQALSEQRVTNAAVVVLENHSGKIRAMVGSADYFSEQASGQVNGAIALRQPGSTLKPFTYLLALERGFNAADALPDIPLHLSVSGGDFSVRNYDNSFRGPVSLRQALACSYNIPAVYLASVLGVETVLQQLHAAGFSTLDKGAGHYGPGLTLGNGEVNLLELVRAYAALAGHGRLPAIRLSENISGLLPSHFGATGILASAEATAIITDILADDQARAPAFGRGGVLALPFDCAVKTGTSKDYRDNWTLGYSSRYTVGVWAGNFDGKSMLRVSGVSGAAPIFRSVMLALHERARAASFVIPGTVREKQVCALSGGQPTSLCPTTATALFLTSNESAAPCSWHQLFSHPETRRMHTGILYPGVYQSWAKQANVPQPILLAEFSQGDQSPPVRQNLAVDAKVSVVFPDGNDLFKMDPVLRPEFQRLKLQVSAPAATDQVIWHINGEKMIARTAPFNAYWQMRPGHFAIHAVAMRGQASDSSSVVRIRVLP